MQNLFDNLKHVLKQDVRLVLNDGSLSKNKIMELALQLDASLIKTLMGDEKLTKQFFIDVDGVLVFEKEKFIRFVQSKEILDDSYTSFKKMIGLHNGDEYLRKNQDTSLVWPYKESVLEGGQEVEDKTRNEIFYNEILAPDEVNRLLDPKVLTNWKKFDKHGVHEVFDYHRHENLILKGNNLLALSSLKNKFGGSVKLIYIDPPYNTGSSTDSFNYNDRFKHSTWLTFMKNRLEIAYEMLAEDGAIFVQIDEHELSYLNVLMDEIFGRDNFVQLITVKTSSPAGFKTVNPGPINVTEYLLFYTKNRNNFIFEKQYVPTSYDDNYNLVIINKEESPENWKLRYLRDVVYEKNGIELGKTPQQSAKNAKKVWGEHWKTIREQLMATYALENADKVVSIRDPHRPSEKLKELLKESKEQKNSIFVYDKTNNDAANDDNSYGYVLNGGVLSFYSNKVRNVDGQVTPTELLTNLWLDIPWDGIAKEGGVTLKNGKKPELLLKRIIQMSTKKDDIVLDFFMGSGTTAAVAHKMDRQYIGIEQLDYGENDAVVRLNNVIHGDTTGISSIYDWKGGGSFVFAELMEWNEQFIGEIETTSNSECLWNIWEKMKRQAFFHYTVDIKEIDENAADFSDLSLENQKQFLIETLDKNHLYVNLSEMKDADYGIEDRDIELNRIFYENDGDKI